MQYGMKAQTARERDEVKRQHLSISDIRYKVWKPAYKAWSQLVFSVKSGALTLEEVDKFFESYKNRKEELLRELSCILSHEFSNTSALKKTVEERAAEIQRYQQLHQYASAADTIWKFKEAMGFSGDFKVIEDLRDQVRMVARKFNLSQKQSTRVNESPKTDSFT